MQHVAIESVSPTGQISSTSMEVEGLVASRLKGTVSNHPAARECGRKLVDNFCDVNVRVE
ncbi:hypothetical protein AXF42_Ash014864 [Apostasia shenzhenica]|uniref:Uncharacterized protein n=1 Tax=Apostasia shenzhenica TaxID=1088818 RepID=A0A2I0ALC8_9ASPA|nr:hypothetical protein AXF42_Ash014864 [Apostasia shenzhenica]